MKKILLPLLVSIFSFAGCYAQKAVKVEYLLVEDVKWQNAGKMPPVTDETSIGATAYFTADMFYYREYRKAPTIEEQMKMQQEAMDKEIKKQMDEGKNNITVTMNIEVKVLPRDYEFFVNKKRYAAYERSSEPGDAVTMIAGPYAYYEKWSDLKIQWKLFPAERKEIAGFTCYKAEGDFRGRHYVVCGIAPTCPILTVHGSYMAYPA